MPLPVIANTFRVGVVQQVSGVVDQLVNVIHVHTSGGLTEADVADNVETAWSARLASQQDNNLLYVETDVLELNGTSGTLQHSWGASPAHGTHGSNEMAPLSTAAIVTLRTGLAGRSNRGRVFFGGLQRSQIDQNTGDALDSSAVTAIQGAWDLFISDLSSAGSDLVVASYVHATEHVVTQAKVRSYLGTQRRRVNRR